MTLDKNQLDEFCPCCDYNTFEGKERLVYSICPICFWEDDPIAFNEPDTVEGPNWVSLTQARKNFKAFGACERDMKRNTRKPDENDKHKLHKQKSNHKPPLPQN